MRFGIDGLSDDIARWREAVGARAPSYHRLLQELASLLDEAPDGEVGARLRAAWASRGFGIFYERPLLLVAALRRDALVEGKGHPLWSALAAPDPDPDGVTRAALLRACERPSLWQSLRDRYVQTNETSRALAWLWPAQIIGAGDGQRPLALFEVGTAAGLNLIGDRLPRLWATRSGVALPTAQRAHVVVRRGIDAHPLDVRDEEDASWLRACVWAGETQRLERLEAAISAFRSSPVLLEQADVRRAPELLSALSAELPKPGVVLAFQTIVRDYLSEPARLAYDRGMREWLEDAPAASALWVELEIDHADANRRVPVVAHARNAYGILDLVLGVTGYHPLQVRVDEAAVARLAGIFD